MKKEYKWAVVGDNSVTFSDAKGYPSFYCSEAVLLCDVKVLTDTSFPPFPLIFEGEKFYSKFLIGSMGDTETGTEEGLKNKYLSNRYSPCYIINFFNKIFRRNREKIFGLDDGWHILKKTKHTVYKFYNVVSMEITLGEGNLCERMVFKLGKSAK
jgi:hypothetical protein